LLESNPDSFQNIHPDPRASTFLQDLSIPHVVKKKNLEFSNPWLRYIPQNEVQIWPKRQKRSSEVINLSDKLETFSLSKNQDVQIRMKINHQIQNCVRSLGIFSPSGCAKIPNKIHLLHKRQGKTE